jgi:site-specific DNA-methyltransferase (adenine-specific)
MELMKQYPDKHFDVAIIDPPYGVNAGCSGTKKNKKTMKIYEDIPPDNNYFNELFRISKNQIIFGANFFLEYIPRRACGWVFWDKCNHYKIFSDGELIWVSCENKIIKYTFDMGYSRGFDYENRIHPNQKPYQIYNFLLGKYTKQGEKIIDTHFGSGSIAIACNNMNVNLTAIEIDPDYFNAACDRIKTAAAQKTFDFNENKG